MHELLRLPIMNLWKSVEFISKCEKCVLFYEKMWRNESAVNILVVIHKEVQEHSAQAKWVKLRNQRWTPAPWRSGSPRYGRLPRISSRCLGGVSSTRTTTIQSSMPGPGLFGNVSTYCWTYWCKLLEWERVTTVCMNEVPLEIRMSKQQWIWTVRWVDKHES